MEQAKTGLLKKATLSEIKVQLKTIEGSAACIETEKRNRT
jgi:hypothetical protein